MIPLAIAPVRDAAPNEMLMGSPTNVVNVVTLDIPVATLIPLEQAFNHVSLFNILVYFSYFFLNVCSLFFHPCILAAEELPTESDITGVDDIELQEIA